MNITENAIPCPVCSTKIPFEVQSLLSGVNFSCPNCLSSIGLAQESAGVLEKTMHQFEELKKSGTKS
ncbi:MAG: transcription initiation factor IIE alpha subunit [Sphingobacteriales bacterium]|jgi:transcription initiation factor IIE alpha subunit